MPKKPVLLLHGIFDTSAKMDDMAVYLKNHGFSPYAPTMHSMRGNVCLDTLAEELQTYVEDKLGEDQTFDIVGFSMGGIVARYYVQKLEGYNRVKTFITLASPHQGSILAHCMPGEGCKQLQPNSDFMNDLNNDLSALKKINFVNMWTPFDLVIVPSSNCKIEVGKEVILSSLRHGWIVHEKDVLDLVKNNLSAHE